MAIKWQVPTFSKKSPFWLKWLEWLIFQNLAILTMFHGISEAGERKNAQAECVEATPNFRKISGKQGNVEVIKINLKYKNDKSQQ